jgi:hypothetical protein
MAKRLVSVQGTCRGFVEVLEPLLYERCQGETHRKSPKISPTFPRRKWFEIPELDSAFSARQCYFFQPMNYEFENCTKFFIYRFIARFIHINSQWLAPRLAPSAACRHPRMNWSGFCCEIRILSASAN